MGSQETVKVSFGVSGATRLEGKQRNLGDPQGNTRACTISGKVKCAGSLWKSDKPIVVRKAVKADGAKGLDLYSTQYISWGWGLAKA